MTTLEASAATESPGQVLRRLEATSLWMWSNEPVCLVGERHELLSRLGMVSTRVERIGFRHEFESDHAVDVAELVACVVELDDLGRRWLGLGCNRELDVDSAAPLVSTG